MTLEEMAVEYRSQAARVRERIRALEQAGRGAGSEEERVRLRIRSESLEPIWREARDLAVLLVDMMETDHYGVYHATNEGGYISWYDFTTEIFRQAAELGHPEYGADHITVVPVTTAEYGVSRAKRPFNSRLDKSKLTENGFTPLPAWQDALNRYLKEVL